MGARYLTRRLLSAVATIGMIVLLNFVLFRMMPGSPERMLLGRTPGVTAAGPSRATRERWGLDKPLFPDQFVAYVGVHAPGRPRLLVHRARSPRWRRSWPSGLGPTLLLFGLGEIIAIVLGLALGAYSGWKRGGLVDHVGNAVSLILYSTPYFLLGHGPAADCSPRRSAGSRRSAWSTAGRDLRRTVFDLLGDLGWHLVAAARDGLARARRPVRDPHALVDPRNAHRGLRHDRPGEGPDRGRILRSHALPNALLPTVSLVAINLGYVVAGAITVEVVFNWPGLGTLTVEALDGRDYPVLQGIFLLLSVTVVLANLAADLVYGLLDPRVRT